MQPHRLEDAAVTRVDLVSQQTQFVQTQATKHCVCDQLIFEQLHVARRDRHLALLFANEVNQREVLALGVIQRLWVVVISGAVPVTLGKVLLQPRGVFEAPAMNSFNL